MLRRQPHLSAYRRFFCTARNQFFAALLAMPLLARPARAVQVHGGAEGLMAHQIGHLLFLGGMAYLLVRIHRRHRAEPGWFEFKFFLYLIILWNCLTFTGHWLAEVINPQQFEKIGGRTIAFQISSPLDFIFYLSQLDHLLLVPAFLFLFLALRRWRASA